MRGDERKWKERKWGETEAERHYLNALSNTGYIKF